MDYVDLVHSKSFEYYVRSMHFKHFECVIIAYKLYRLKSIISAIIIGFNLKHDDIAWYLSYIIQYQVSRIQNNFRHAQKNSEVLELLLRN